MPAGFNKGQIEYIKTIANVNGHKTYKAYIKGSQNHAHNDGHQALSDGNLRYDIWCLGQRPLMLPVGSVNGTTDVVPNSAINEMPQVYSINIEQDQSAATADDRVTPECFLESVNCRMRHIVNLDKDSDEDVNSHQEFRLIVFRHKEKQHWEKQLAENFSDPHYDLFHGAGNTKYGVRGKRNKMDDQGNINYVGHTGYDNKFDRDRLMTDPVNMDDYVVMKDCRYYLGREYGGKHIYEDRFHWDHEDPIVTDRFDITAVDSNKNYCWYIMLLCTNNSIDQSTPPDNLGYINFAFNTHVTSG